MNLNRVMISSWPLWLKPPGLGTDWDVRYVHEMASATGYWQ